MKSARLYKGVTRPGIRDTLTDNNRAVDLTGATITFFMRHATSGVLKIDDQPAAVDGSDPKSGKVIYLPEAADVDTVDSFFGWFRADISGELFDGDEIFIPVDEHSPGYGVEFGALADRVQGILTVDFNKLSRWEGFGDRRLQDTIEVVKLRVLNVTVPVDQEAGLHLLVQSYLAKKIALELIPACRNYWMVQVQSVSTNEPDTAESYPDRLKALTDLQSDLMLQIAHDEVDVLPLITNPRTRSDGPKISEDKVARVTTDPADFPSYEEFPSGASVSL